MTPTTNRDYFPAWMAGPLGGLWPRHALGEQSVRTLVTAILVAMYLSYMAAVTLGGRLRARWVLGAILATHLAASCSRRRCSTPTSSTTSTTRAWASCITSTPTSSVPILEPHGDPAFTLSNWHWLVSPRTDLFFTLLTYVLVPLGVAGGFWALKCALPALRASLSSRWCGASAQLPRAQPRSRGRARRPEPDRARVGPGRRPQRHLHGAAADAWRLPADSRPRRRPTPASSVRALGGDERLSRPSRSSPPVGSRRRRRWRSRSRSSPRRGAVRSRPVSRPPRLSWAS